MADGQVIFEITADGRHAIASVKDVTKAIETETGKWDRSTQQSTGTMDNAFSGMLKKVGSYFAAAKVGQVLLDWGKAAVEAASDLQEVQNVVDTVFGDNAVTIERWAKKAGTQFGLTETQAKKFTSTLGAMMKSSGLAGDEIVGMSTDLAGLAADMASFYNLDFETAFEKIRSGISGETEPLKQLGINMSVANLNAFALEKGLSKTFEQMTQGEQVMLRYQYMMQATADAQGDFEKTSDGFANSQRRIQAAIEGIAAKAGSFVLEVIEPLQGNIADFLESFVTEGKRTILDDMEDITAEKDAKIADIQAVTETAKLLVQELEKIGRTDPGAAMAGIASGANGLNAKSPELWKGLLTSLTSIDGLENVFGEGSEAAGNIEALAGALSGAGIDQNVADAWQTLLNALGSNEDALSSLTGKSGEEAKKWLDEIAAGANSLNPNSADGWDKLLGQLISGMPGLANSEEGKKFLESLATGYLALGSESETATAGLAQLGFTTEDITKQQNAWLETCRKLVQIIPGLSAVINTETGEVKGGIQAIQDYVDAWSAENILQAKIDALRQQKTLLEDAMNVDTSTSVMTARASAIGALMGREGMTRQQAEDYLARYTMNRRTKSSAKELSRSEDDLLLKFLYGSAANLDAPGTGSLESVTESTTAALDEYVTATAEATEKSRSLPGAIEYLDEQIAQLEAETGQSAETLLAMSGAAGQAEEEMTLLEKALQGDKEAAKQLAPAYTQAAEALTALSDYYEQVRDATEQAVDSTLRGFEKVGKAGDELREKLQENGSELAKAEAKYSSLLSKYGGVEGIAGLDSDAWSKLPSEVQSAYNEIVKLKNAQDELNQSIDAYSPKGMIDGLQSQIDFIDEYLANLERARELGLSADLLAELSDGSKESAEMLSQIADSDAGTIEELNGRYAELQEKKEQFTGALTDSKLEADETYDALVMKAIDAIGDLNLQEQAAQSMGDTVLGIAQGIRDNVPEVQSAMDSLIAQLDRLEGHGMSFGFGFGGLEFLFHLDGSNAKGLDYVPFDGYLSELHEGEGILTAEENRVWQRFKNGQAASANVDYDALGGLMRDNVQAGGNVYLDGKTVGRVVSGIQGDQYRTLQRSGWQQ